MVKSVSKDKDKIKQAEDLRKDLTRQLNKLDDALGKAKKGRKSLRETNREYMQRRRFADAGITIPPAKDPEGTLELESNPETWLRHFFPDRYYLPFSKVHKELISNVVNRAKNGGDQAIAAPRGEGKSEVVIGLMVYLICARICEFPVIIAATNEMALAMYNEVRYHIETNEELASRYPLVCFPVRALEGTSMRAKKQHVNGKQTRMQWDTRAFTLAEIEGSPYSGVTMKYFGMDSAFRGVRVRGKRPDFVLVDDPETESSAVSPKQIATREKLLTRAVAGLAGPDKTLSICLVGTIQNDYCLTARITDPSIFPSFNGKRYGVLETFPKNKELWDEYIEIRKLDQQGGDELGQKATQFYKDNRELMDEGAVVTNQHRFNKNHEISSIQAAYNFICDRGFEAFAAECQNDPIPDDDIQTLGLTPRIVQTRLHFDEKGEVPKSADIVTMGIDIGKYSSHWVQIAWDSDICAGRIIDYGVAETTGLAVQSDEVTVEHAISRMLMEFREEVVMKCPITPDAVMIDSGDFTDTVYRFVAEAGSPFYACKGWGQRPGMFVDSGSNKKKMYGDNWTASILQSGLVLYNVNSDHWKKWVHQRLMTRTWDEGNSLVSGSLSLFASEDKRQHHSISYHLTAEELREEFIEGKGIKRYWHVNRKNNHWLDAVTYASSATSMLGISLSQSI